MANYEELKDRRGNFDPELLESAFPERFFED
jgi:hypothetical protein